MASIYKTNYKTKFQSSVQQGYLNYLTSHPRSNTKIAPIHSCLGDIVLQELSTKLSKLSKKSIKNWTIKSMGTGDNKEYTYKGKYYLKDVDITCCYKGNPMSGIGFKFVTSNYKQNSNNYFENMLGETANLKRADFLYAQLLVFKHKMPYFSSDKKTFTKIEHIDDKNIKKYLSLYNDDDSLFHKPDLMHICFVETGDELEFEKVVLAHKKGNTIKVTKNQFHKKQTKKVKVKFIKTQDLSTNYFNDNTLNFLKKVGDFDEFIKKFVTLSIDKSGCSR
jgi:hypothetical protein